jgi:hypothetical protein
MKENKPAEKKRKSYIVKLPQAKIDAAIKTTTEEELRKVFPKTKRLYSKLSHAFYRLKPNLWAKVYYQMKDGTYCSQHTEMHTDNILYDKFRVEIIYTGNEKTQNFKNLWNL